MDTNEVILVSVGIAALTVAVVTHSASEQVYGSLMGALLGYAFHSVATQTAVTNFLKAVPK